MRIILLNIKSIKKDFFMALIAELTEEVISRFQRGYNRRQKKSERSEILIATGKASIIQL